MPDSNPFFKLIRSPVRYRGYLLRYLPMGLLAGLRVREVTTSAAAVTIRYKYLVKNPFGSIYFACQSMAAEMSTGVLAMAAALDEKPKVSILVAGMEADFIKQAHGTITFRCEDGQAIFDAVSESRRTGEKTTVTARSTGTDESGDTVARFRIEWSFKAV